VGGFYFFTDFTFAIIPGQKEKTDKLLTRYISLNRLFNFAQDFLTPIILAHYSDP